MFLWLFIKIIKIFFLLLYLIIFFVIIISSSHGKNNNMRKVAKYFCLALRTKVFPSQSEEGAICGYRKNHLLGRFLQKMSGDVAGSKYSVISKKRTYSKTELGQKVRQKNVSLRFSNRRLSPSFHLQDKFSQIRSFRIVISALAVRDG